MKRTTLDFDSSTSSKSSGSNVEQHRLFPQNQNVVPKENDGMERSSSSTDATKALPSCFKETTFYLNILPGCCPSLPPLQPSSTHSVMFKVPIVNGTCPPPIPDEYCDSWDNDHVQMPCSPKSKCSVEDGGKGLKNRWELIEEKLSQDIKSSHDLEAAILSYNKQCTKKWNFCGLHIFFEKLLDARERTEFFQTTLPAMKRLALNLPQICTQPIPFLKEQMNHAITLTQKQIACLLCNAFFCTFLKEKIPNKYGEKKQGIKFANYPNINFNKLYSGTTDSITPRKAGKLRCLINYFSRVTTNEPTGTVTFRRQCLVEFPEWSLSQKSIRHVVVDSDGVIEVDGRGMLQVDFADKFIGGIVLDNGCVQEEIRFVICPELIISRLFTERMGSCEVVLISGAEQYNEYRGYANSFMWNGDYQDHTPRDEWGRRSTKVLAMDALCFRNPADQYKTECLQREVNKAFCGFSDEEVPPENLPAVATGNWGCGVFKGNPHFKFLIQLMAASQAGRDIIYFTFHDDKLKKELENMYRLVLKRKLTVGNVWDLLSSYNSSGDDAGKEKFYDYVCTSL